MRSLIHRCSTALLKHKFLALFLVIIIFQLALILSVARNLCSARNLHFSYKKIISVTSPTERCQSIECNGRMLLNRQVKEFTEFVVELNSSQQFLFDSGVLNFSYTFKNIDMEHWFTNEYSGYNSLRVNKAVVRKPTRGYIYLMSVGQELSQCTRHLLEMCLYASSSYRKVVTPQMRDGRMRIGGHPFGKFFNVTNANEQLQRFGYSELATEEEFSRNCHSVRKKVVIVFYEEPENPNLPAYFSSIIDKFGIYETVKKQQWMDCTKNVNAVHPFLKVYQNNADYFCIYQDIFRDAKTFNEKVLGNSKCVYVNAWNALYNFRWQKFKRDAAPTPFKILYWFLHPVLEIINEANAFREMRIQSPYVAIHIRGAKFKNKTFLEPCFDVALEFVNALRRTRNVKSLFLATDMSKFGGRTNTDKSSHEIFAEKSGAVIYDPNVAKTFTNPDRWMVSLTEVRLLSQSDHLITIGQGSFGGFIRYRYLWEHRNKEHWTINTLCMKTATKYF